jgi:7,8-dihydropterin-6-yl-methyl-4-(beta-D-ribofuranosyl)aminobenzene 5'-phosphate synthase
MSPELLKHESEMHLSDTPQFIIEGVWTTGEILDRSEPEGRSAHHVVRSGEDWIADPYRDDMSLVLETKAGLYLVCGCCHAGLLNTLAHVKHTFGKEPIGVMGGTHLVGASHEQIDHTVERLRDMGSPALHLNHCTGQPAFVALSQAFGDRVAHCPADTVLEL